MGVFIFLCASPRRCEKTYLREQSLYYLREDSNSKPPLTLNLLNPTKPF
jgi:hypothetical protein